MDELGGLTRARGGFDDESVVKRLRDQVAVVLVEDRELSEKRSEHTVVGTAEVILDRAVSREPHGTDAAT